MSDNSKIEWTNASWNPIRALDLKTGKVGWHCEHATTGCQFCYAEGINKRLGTGLPFKPGHLEHVKIFLDDKTLLAPLRWKRPRMIFVCSMSDLFADFVTDDMLHRIFSIIGNCEDRGLGHTFQILTKRGDRMRQWVSKCGSKAWNAGRIGPSAWPARNMWFGVSCERQQEADERIPLLLQTPAAVRFISAEPLLGPIDLRCYLGEYHDENKTGGRVRISSDRDGRIGDRRAGPDLAARSASLQSLDGNDQVDSVPSSQGGARRGRVFSNQNDVGRQEGVRERTSAGLEIFQRTDPGGDDYQSQERAKEAELAGQLGAGDRQRADQSCEGCAGQGKAGPYTEQQSEADRISGRGNSAQEGAGREPSELGRRIRRDVSGHFEDFSRPTLGLSWVICGGESGPKARPMHPDWARSLRDQCQAAGVAFFFKQWGEWAPGECADKPAIRTERVAWFFDGGWAFGSLTPRVSSETHYEEEPDVYWLGKKAAGRLLDGRTHDEMPGRVG